MVTCGKKCKFLGVALMKKLAPVAKELLTPKA